MKNIHKINNNIYITSNEEIKEKLLLNKTDYYCVKNHYNEWYVGKFNGNSFDFINDNGNFNSNLFVCKKIILTDNQDLIKEINDVGKYTYKIIIPQEEEPKQESLEEFIKEVLEGVFFSNNAEYRKAERLIELGAKWQSKRMYSEEEVKHIVSEALQSALVNVDLEQWFENNKKK
jgi:hypothetical protein